MKSFDNLSPRSVTTFDDLARKFLTRFSIQKDKVKHASSLLGVKQEIGESLRDYMERFNKACLEIQYFSTEALIMGLVNGLREGLFSPSISKRYPTSLNEVQERAEKYINMEENARKIFHTEKLPLLVQLKIRRVEVVLNIAKKLAREGRLDKYLIERSDSHEKSKRDEEDTGRRDRPTRTPERYIHTIVGGFAGGGLTKSFRKRHLKEVYQVEEEIPDSPTISFTKEDTQGIIPRHDDPVVITMILANANLHKTLVDQGNSADILFKPAFDKLVLEEKELKAYPNILFRLGDTPIRPLGFISLHTTFGKGMKSKTLSIDYIVVDVALAYNALIGRTILNRLGAVVFIPHLCMKFPTQEGIATVRGDKKLARKYYNKSLNLRGKGKEVNSIEFGGVRGRNDLRPQPERETEEVQIRNEVGKTTNIGVNPGTDLKEDLIKVLRENSGLFAWKASDMPGIDLDLMTHKLAVYHRSRPV
ncbi:uncharacterized protein [Arachis hypogaea]|uniref:uncharacterized protein n=1 Tax=Arachis hypogaea TaxID=3818 RepID=UPI000DEDC6F8|nr:uncharacterized protein LOC112769541 [Arachis hypogaea]